MIKLGLLPRIIAFIYRIWSWTWRLEVLEHPEFKEALARGSVAFAHWHGDEMVVLCLGPRYRCAAMTSTSSDGELMTRILERYGFGISRGSSTRGGARALVGMVKLVGRGYNATVAVDGPKGPRYEAKPGILHLAKHANIPVIPTGVARGRAIVFEKSWNKTYLPLPFSRVVVSFGPPLPAPLEINEKNQSNLQEELNLALFEQRGHAQKILNQRGTKR